MDSTPTLNGHPVACADLTEPAIQEMYALFSAHFAETTPERFRHDLSNKNWAILLRDPQATLRGFSTLALYETTAVGRRISVVVSGDTLIQPEFWGTPELPRVWIRTVLHLSAGMAQPLYWLLISSGYKTYRFLPVFYKEFYPRHDRPTPPETQALLDRLAGERYGTEYDPRTGIVRFDRGGATPLREGIADIEADRLRNKINLHMINKNINFIPLFYFLIDI